MIYILQNWEEIGAAILALQRNNIPFHNTIQKNWDLFLTLQFLLTKKTTSKIIDLGCGDGSVLTLINSMGFINSYGLDLNISWRLRLGQIRRIFSQQKIPYHLKEADITKTNFPDSSYDIAICISVIEHGVNLESFFREASRILRRSGTLLLTTDYWSSKIEVDSSIKPFGCSWKIFSREEIQQMINLAKAYNLVLCRKMEIPSCEKRTVYWQRQEYTFIALIFEKQNHLTT